MYFRRLMSEKIYLAPLQGFTDFVYRKAWQQVFNAVDAYFVPYVSIKNGELLRKYQRELLPENNPPKRVVPQALVKDGSELLHITNHIKNLGYKELNVNLGCPYPMVTRKGRGAGLLPNPEAIKALLNEFFEHEYVSLSVKFRAGLNSSQEMETILPILNTYPLKEIILHPRIATQLYKGTIIDDAFAFAQKHSKHPLVFNGDIFDVDDFRKRKAQFPECNSWMLGRGILMNPFLPSEIKGLKYETNDRRNKLIEFHDLIAKSYLIQMDNEGNALNKMQQFWVYFSYNFPQQKKVFKAIKKARNMQKYREETARIFRSI